MGARRKPSGRSAVPIVALDDGTAATAVLAKAVQAAHDGAERAFETGIDGLTTAPVADGDAALDGAAGRVLTALYLRGWQPADVIRAVDPSHRSHAGAMIGRHLRGYPADRVGARWIAQVNALDADPVSTGRHDTIRAAIEVLAIINYLPALPVLEPPPGVARVRKHPVPASHRRMLNKIRGLLAKAESTTYPDEAESYSAKAQELMTRHRIDHALVADEATDPSAPIGVRVTVDSPYADAKALLLHVVAETNGCQAVWSAEHGFTTVFGFAEEIEAVELLYTSLLVQGTAAMVREGSARHDSPARTKTFRQSFMHAYALRIGARLDKTAAATATTQEVVLARRDQVVRDEVERIFPGTTSKGRSIRVDSEAGWRSGAEFGNRAALDQ